MVPGWSWRVDKAFRLLPITGAIVNVTTPGKTRHAKGTLAAAGYLAGPRPFTVDPVEAKTQLLFDELDNLTSEQAALKQTVKHRSGEPWAAR